MDRKPSRAALAILAASWVAGMSRIVVLAAYGRSFVGRRCTFSARAHGGRAGTQADCEKDLLIAGTKLGQRLDQHRMVPLKAPDENIGNRVPGMRGCCHSFEL